MVVIRYQFANCYANSANTCRRPGPPGDWYFAEPANSFSPRGGAPTKINGFSSSLRLCGKKYFRLPDLP